MEYEEKERGDLKEATQYLELRNRLKESIRRKNMKSSCDSHTSQKMNESPYNGSFFGPSQHCIAKRVIEQRKELLHSKLPHGKKVTTEHALPEANKVKFLKRSRDYSFLSSDDPPDVQPENKKLVIKPKGKPIESIKSTQEKKIVGSSMKLKSKSIESLESIEANKKIVRSSNNFQRKLSIKPCESTLSKKKHVRRPMNLQGKRIESTQPKKKIVRSSNNEDDEAIRMIRKMFNTKRFVGRDDRDVRGMESKFGDILKEEKRSERLASKEDAEQLRLIEEEEQQNKLKLLSKKRRV